MRTVAKWVKDNKGALVSGAVAVGALLQGTLHEPQVHEVMAVAGAVAAVAHVVADVATGLILGASGDDA